MSRFVLVALFIGLAATAPARAEKAPLSPEELRATATHIVVGKVGAIYTRTDTIGDWQYIRYVAEVRIAESEKGDGVKKGDLVFARYYHKRWAGKGKQPPASSGHTGTPNTGDTVRVYLARNAYDGFTEDNNDGGFNVIGGNGFEKLERTEK